MREDFSGFTQSLESDTGTVSWNDTDQTEIIRQLPVLFQTLTFIKICNFQNEIPKWMNMIIRHALAVCILGKVWMKNKQICLVCLKYDTAY
jgi:hypothetical protein